ncbi:MAG: hypothetical protein L3J34_04885 [Flavobacteriaceae bacterium]|nr:hypothetical protein [Flavobacteriaceae bacterium]
MKLLFLFLSIFILSLELNITDVRKNYKEAVISKSKTFLLNDDLKGITKNDDQRFVAYKGAVMALTARHLKGVKLKGEAFKNGAEWIEHAVSHNSSDIEIRFVRLSIQQNSPKFLGYNDDIKADKNFLLKNFRQVKSTELKEYLKGYILESENFTEDEKNVILAK